MPGSWIDNVYVADDVAAVEALHPYLRDEDFRASPIRAQVHRMADTLFEAHCKGDARAAIHMASWWPEARGQSRDGLMAAPFSRDDALTTMAREFGFADAGALDPLGETGTDAAFEDAVDDVIAGRHKNIAQRLRSTPDLVRMRSRYGHRSTLLHYLGANGVETHRQKTPRNAADMARLLISHGAKVAAEADMYGGGQTAHVLAATSAHPAEAGVAEELCRVLRVD